MEQRIRFCSGSEGKSIACAVAGSGPPLLCSAWWVSHLEHDWAQPRYRQFFSALAERHTLIRYDRLGVGLSDRSNPDFTLASELANMEAVAQHHRLDRFALIGGSLGAPVAIAFAAAHPQRVSHLVIYGGFATGDELAPAEIRSALTALIRAHWGMGSKALADIFVPDLSAEEAKEAVAMQREACSAVTAARLLELMYQFDVEEAARNVRVPTLILHRRKDRAIPFEMARQLAALIPAAELVTLEGNHHMPWYGDGKAVTGAVLRFLDGESPAAAPRDGPAASTNRFVREGEVWGVTFAGTTVHLKHSKGLGDLACLLSRPGADVEAVELAQGHAPDRVATSAGEPVLDRRALDGYRARLRELERDLDEAASLQHLGERQKLEDEQQALIDQLRKAIGLGGRTRKLGDDAERARKAVSGRIRQSIAAIRAVHPSLAEHLERSIATGTFCSYSPEITIAWET